MGQLQYLIKKVCKGVEMELAEIADGTEVGAVQADNGQDCQSYALHAGVICGSSEIDEP